MNFILDEWRYLLSAINNVECSAETLVVNLYAHSDFEKMPEKLGGKLDKLDLMECDRLHGFLLEFWNTGSYHTRDVEKRLKEIGAMH